MDTNATTTVTHGLTVANIRSVAGIIREDSDAGVDVYAITAGHVGTPAEIEVFVESIGVTVVHLERQTGGIFDTTSFNETSYNRGWITITYIA